MFQEKIIALSCLLSGAILLRFALAIAGMSWAKTLSHTLTFILLPIITYAITAVISNNIALSLGMVGALSIVRFRHPVRSPFELTSYFYLIALGITATVNYKWTLLLAVIPPLIIFMVFHFNRLVPKLFVASFSEGNSFHQLEISTNQALDLSDPIFNPVRLQSSSKISGRHVYLFSGHDHIDLLKLKDRLEEINPDANLTYRSA